MLKIAAVGATESGPKSWICAASPWRSTTETHEKMGTTVLGEEVTMLFAAQIYGEAGDLMNLALQVSIMESCANLACTVEDLNAAPVR